MAWNSLFLYFCNFHQIHIVLIIDQGLFSIFILEFQYIFMNVNIFFYEKLYRSMSQTFELLEKNTKMP